MVRVAIDYAYPVQPSFYIILCNFSKQSRALPYVIYFCLCVVMQADASEFTTRILPRTRTNIAKINTVCYVAYIAKVRRVEGVKAA